MQNESLILEELYNDIIADKNVEKSYNKLAKIMKNANMFQEEAGCLERLWHITKNHSLMIKVGDILANKLNNHQKAQYAYNTYFLASNPKFYNVYSKNIKELTQNINFHSKLDDFSLPIIKLADKYNLLIYIFKYAHYKKNYSFILKKSSKLAEIEHKAKGFFKQNDNTCETYMKEIKNAKNHLSSILSQVNDNLGINILAMNLKPDNEKAHINLLNIHITDKNYNEALNLFNTKYSTEFSLQQIDNPIDLCKYLAEFYRNKCDYYNTLKFQKIALELDLGAN